MYFSTGFKLYSQYQSNIRSFEENEDVLVKRDGVNVRGWILRPDGAEHSLVAFNSNVSSVIRIANQDIQPNTLTKIEPEKKKLTNFTVSQTGAYFLANDTGISNYLVLVSNKGEVFLFNKNTMELIKKESLGIPVLTAALSRGYLAIESLVTKKVFIYSIPDFKLQQEINTSDGIRYLTFDKNERLAIQVYSKGIYIYDTKNKQMSGSMFPEKKTGLITMLQFSKDGNYLFTAIESKSKPGIIIYESKDLTIKNPKFISIKESIYSISLNANGSKLAIGSANGISLFSYYTMKIDWTYKLPTKLLAAPLQTEKHIFTILLQKGMNLKKYPIAVA